MSRPIDERYNRKAVEVESLALDVASLIIREMELSGVKRAELARRMGISRAQLNQMLNGDHDMTLKTVAEALYELDIRLTIGIKLLPGKVR
jgi:transcriptional regulator with XRE-family HTH domain